MPSPKVSAFKSDNDTMIERTMNQNRLKQYAPQARRDFIAAVTDRAAYFGLTQHKIEPMTEQGDVVLISGKPYPRGVGAKRKRLEERLSRYTVIIEYEQLPGAPFYRTRVVGRSIVVMLNTAHRFYEREAPSWRSVCFGWEL